MQLDNSLNILALPAFADNYLWLIHDGTHAAVVDPGEAQPVLDALHTHKLTLSAILLTHHHRDHVGGVPELTQKFSAPVFGPAHDGIAGITVPLTEGNLVEVPKLGLKLNVLEVPGHTHGHIAYYASQANWLFCGDTLFAGGCGRLFEGTPAQMVASLSKLAALPDETKVYCAHEYTLSNLRFAQEIEPGNSVLQGRVKDEQRKRNQGLPTIPSTIGLEKATNPFLRYTNLDIVNRLIEIKKVSSREPIAIFAAIREWKNSYK